MRKIIFICLGFCLYLSNLEAKDLIPNYSLTTSGGVTDLVLKNEHLYVATAASSIDIFNLKTIFSDLLLLLLQSISIQ